MHFCFIVYLDLLILLIYDYTSSFNVIVIFMHWYRVSTSRYQTLSLGIGIGEKKILLEYRW